MADALAAGELTVDGDLVVAVDEVTSNPAASRSPAVIASARTVSGRPVRLLVKIGPRAGEWNDAGDPWGVAYERRVYADALSTITALDSPFIGHVDLGGGRLGLVLRWLGEARPVSSFIAARGLVPAAAWLGTFQAEASGALASGAASGLVDHRGAVLRWVGLTRNALRRHAAGAPRLAWALDHLEELVAPLTDVEPTVVHGDLYPPNVLVDGRTVTPVDWEWAGSGAGEIDLAALTDGWPRRDRERCVEAYLRARGSESHADASLARLAAARLFLAARWIGGHVTPLDPLPTYWADLLVTRCEAIATSAPPVADADALDVVLGADR